MQIAQASHRPLPVARRRNLIVKDLPDETLIYDLDSDQAHCLNHTAALVWKNCDGSKNVSQLRALVEKESSGEVPEEVIWLALDQLEKFHLLGKVPDRPTYLAAMNRRELVRRFGAALAVPLVVSIVAPTAQAQGSPGCHNQTCVDSSQCCPQHPVCSAANKCK